MCTTVLNQPFFKGIKQKRGLGRKKKQQYVDKGKKRIKELGEGFQKERKSKFKLFPNWP